MFFSTHLALNNLHCVTPTDPSGEDEPYLWVFFFKADGSNIRQRANDPTHLSANVSVITGSGRPGNLNVSSVHSGGNIHVPASIGVFDGNLTPIVLSAANGAQTIRVFVPGRVGVICIAIDEDSAPRDAMEGAFNDVKALVTQRLNDFLNGLDLKAMAQTALTSANPTQSFQDQFNALLAAFIKNVREEAVSVAKQSAEIAVMSDSDWWNPVDIVKSAVAGLDPDEPIGKAQFILSERDILNANLHRSLHADLRQSKDGLGGAWYIIDGFLDASIAFNSADHQIQTLPDMAQVMGTPETYTFQRDHILVCVWAGTQVEVARLAHTEQYLFNVEYPVSWVKEYEYSIDGQVLTGSSGTITLTKTVRIPEFDEDALQLNPLFVKFRQESRLVQIHFEKKTNATDPQIEQLVLTNNPADGNYDILLKCEAVLPDGRHITVGDEVIFFEGQTIKLPDYFLKHAKDCLDNFVGTRWAKSKLVTLKDLWGPVARWEQFEEAAKRLDELAAAGVFDKKSVAVSKEKIATALQLKQR